MLGGVTVTVVSTRAALSNPFTWFLLDWIPGGCRVIVSLSIRGSGFLKRLHTPGSMGVFRLVSSIGMSVVSASGLRDGCRSCGFRAIQALAGGVLVARLLLFVSEWWLGLDGGFTSLSRVVLSGLEMSVHSCKLGVGGWCGLVCVLAGCGIRG